MATTTKKSRKRRAGWGTVRRLPSGRWQASYVGPDTIRHTAPDTFEFKIDADEWLTRERRMTLDPDTWIPPKVRAQQRKTGATLRDFAPAAIRRRKVRGRPLTPRTIAHYDRLLDRVLYPTFGDEVLAHITPQAVMDWYDALDPDKPTQRAHAYSLLSSLLQQAIDEETERTRRPVARVNPCAIKGAGTTSRKRPIKPATPAQIRTIAEAMPPRMQALILLTAWAGLRFGEVTELRRRDLDLEAGTVRVERGVTWVDGAEIVGETKSAAGIRTIALPPHIIPKLSEHLEQHTEAGADALLFPKEPGEDDHLRHIDLHRLFVVARDAAGRPDLRLHDLRHTAAVLAAQSGATLAELMARLGHSTPRAALLYQHAAQGRDAAIAAALSQIAEGTDAEKGKK